MDAAAANPRLRLIRRPDTPLLRQLDALEATYSHHHNQLLESLADIEAELPQLHPRSAAGAHEQIAFIRVGLRCLADAVAELHASIDTATTNPAGDDTAGAA